MFNQKNITKLLTATAVAFVLAGCGQSSPASANDPSLDPSSGGGYSDPAAGGGANPYGGATGTGTNPYGGSTTPAPVADTAQLTASVTKKKNGVFLGMGAYKCTVEVTNPGTTSHTGTLTVTFMNGSKQSKTAPITKQVTLGRNETQSFDFSDPKWSTNNVTVDVTTEASTAGAAAPASSYGAPGAPGATGTYGASGTTGSTGASSYPTGY